MSETNEGANIFEAFEGFIRGKVVRVGVELQ